MTPDERFEDLRKRIYKMIADCLVIDGHCKSYEGAIEVTKGYPSYFDRGESPSYRIELHCYLLCNGRHEAFTGDTLEDALTKFERRVLEMESEQARYISETLVDPDLTAEYRAKLLSHFGERVLR